jgi:hypothetical protein
MAQRLIAFNFAVMADPRLDLLDKLILSYIKDWELKGRPCFAKDGFFASFFGVGDGEILLSLLRLESLGLIEQIVGTGGRLIRSKKTENSPAPEIKKDVFEL